MFIEINNNKFLNISIKVNGPINKWDRVILTFKNVDNEVQNAYYIAGTYEENQINIRNIRLLSGYQDIKLTAFGDFEITALQLSNERKYTEFELNTKSNCIDFNGNQIFETGNKLNPSKILITIPGVGDNVSETSQYPVMIFRNQKLESNIFRAHFIDGFDAKGTSLVYNDDSQDNIAFILYYIKKLQDKYNIEDDKVVIMSASKGSIGALELFKVAPNFKYQIMAPILNLDNYNASTSQLRYLSRSLMIQGYKFNIPELNENVVLYTSKLDEAYDESKLFNSIVKYYECKHTEIVKLALNEFIDYINQ